MQLRVGCRKRERWRDKDYGSKKLWHPYQNSVKSASAKSWAMKCEVSDVFPTQKRV
jgi:hypothetical protein